MASRPASIRIPEDTRRDIEDTARRSGRTFSSVANEMLDEAVRMRRIPGIAFHDTPSGREAVIAGTGLDVWEIARSYRDNGRDWDLLQQEYDWLEERQLRAALAYAEAYPEEIEEALADSDRWTPEHGWSTYPVTRPPRR